MADDSVQLKIVLEDDNAPQSGQGSASSSPSSSSSSKDTKLDKQTKTGGKQPTGQEVALDVASKIASVMPGILGNMAGRVVGIASTINQATKSYGTADAKAALEKTQQVMGEVATTGAKAASQAAAKGLFGGSYSGGVGMEPPSVPSSALGKLGGFWSGGTAGEAIPYGTAEMTGAGEAAAGLSATGVGLIVVAVVAAIAATVVAFNKLTSELDKVTNKYGEYSAGIAQAQAGQEITRVLNDMRRAQQYEPQLVRYIQLQTEMEQRYEEVKIKILMALEPLAELGLEGINGILAVVQIIAGFMEQSGKLLKGDVLGFLEGIFGNTKKAQESGNSDAFSTLARNAFDFTKVPG